MSDKTKLVNKLNRAKSIRKIQVACPTSKKTFLVSPLTVGDDVDLRTMISDITLYDKTLCDLLYKHCEEILSEEDEENGKEAMTFLEFKQSVSYFDRKLLLKGLHTSTYNNIGKQKIKCKDTGCGHEVEVLVKSKDLDHEFKVWDKEVEFNKYKKNITTSDPNSDIIVSTKFITKLPTISDNLKLLEVIPTDKVKLNNDTLGTVIDQVEFLALITDKIIIKTYEFDDDDNLVLDDNDKPVTVVDEIDAVNDIMEYVRNYVSLDEKTEITEKYEKSFNDYNPTFKYIHTCPKCGTKRDVVFDIEVLLIRSFLRLGD